MSAKIERTELIEIAAFNSGYISGGMDYWTIFTHSRYPDLIFIHSEGSNFGWEYDSWEYSKKQDELILFLKSEKNTDSEKCQRILATERFSIRDLGLSIS